MRTNQAQIIPSLLFVLFFSTLTIGYGQNQITDQVFTVIDSLPQSAGGITIDKLGYVYSADFDGKVYKINPFSKKVELYAEGFYLATGNTFDQKGRLYQANLAGNYISRIDRSGKEEIFADSLLSSPVGIAFNSRNELFVCNCGNRSITKVSADGKTVKFAESGLFHCPNGIVADAMDNLYIVSYNNNNVVKISPDGKVSLFAQTPDKIGNGHLVIANNKIYITGFHGHRLYEVNMDGEVKIFAGTGERGAIDGNAGNAKFTYPNGIAFNPSNNTLYINERHKDQKLPSIHPGKTVIRAIKLARISDTLKKEIDSNGIKNVKTLYTRLKKSSRFANEDTEVDINNLGHQYLYIGKNEAAAAVFALNIKSYPERVLAYAFMGRTMNNAGKSKEAIKYYKKALDIRPGSTSLKARLEQLMN